MVSFINNGYKNTTEINIVTDDDVNTNLVAYKNECIKLNGNKQELMVFLQFLFCSITVIIQHI